MSKTISALLLTLFMFTTMGCNELVNFRPLKDINNLEGRRVGVALTFSPDYILTGRKDMHLIRYNTNAALMTALRYRRVDIVALDKSIANTIMQNINGLRIVSPPIATHGFVAYVPKGKKEILDEFNEFIVEFRQTETFKDLEHRINSEPVFKSRPVVNVKGDRTLKVVTDIEAYPYCYLKEDNSLAGCDIEYITHFANAYGYNLELIPKNYQTMELYIRHNKADMAISQISNVWNDDITSADIALISDVYLKGEVVFVEIDDINNLKIISTID